MSQWVVIVRNDEWTCPDGFGPFPNRTTADLWIGDSIDLVVTDTVDIQVQELLNPKEYEEDDDTYFTMSEEESAKQVAKELAE